jgi:hypothetical protein
MNRGLSLTVANLGLMRAFDEIAKAAGVTYEQVVKSETQKILEAAARNTIAAQVKLIEANERAQPVRFMNGKIYFMNNRYPDALWAQLQAKVKRSIQVSKEARGLSKKSWKQLAERLGFDIDVPGYVAQATTKNGDYPEDAKARENREGSDFSITLQNARTYSPSVYDAIRKAMNGREKFFKENLKTGVFKSIETIAAKYPGLKMS